MLKTIRYLSWWWWCGWWLSACMHRWKYTPLK